MRAISACRNLVRSTKGPPRRVRTAPRVRAGTSPRSGAAARHATRNVRATCYSVQDDANTRIPNTRSGPRRPRRPAPRPKAKPKPRRITGLTPSVNVSGLNIQFDIVLFHVYIRSNRHRLPGSWWRARAAPNERRPRHRGVCTPLGGFGLLVRPLVGGPATMTPDMMRGATRRSVKKKVDLEVKHASRLSE